jgi:tetratricopeptide (TPR) repeat protein
MPGESETPQAPPSVAGSSRRRVLWAAAITAVVVIVPLGYWLRGYLHRPEPPLPDLSEVDPEVAEAVQEARQEVLRHRTSAPAWGRLGEVLNAHELNQDALRCFAQAEALDHRELAWPYLQGLILLAYDPEAAIPCLERAVARSPDGPLIPRLVLAETLLERGQFHDSQTHLEEALRLEPENTRAQLGLARIAFLRRDWQAGLKHLDACQEDVHCRRLVHGLRGEAWKQLGKPDLARADQEQAVKLPPDQAWPDPYRAEVQQCQRGLPAHMRKVEALLQARQTEDARQELEFITDKYPQSMEAWMRLGGIWHQMQRLDEAARCYQKAVQVAPAAAEAWFRLGTMQALLGRAPEAIESFRQAIGLKPHHAQAHYNLGRCLQKQGDPKGAAAEFEAALNSRPDYELARTALRELQSQRGKER